MSIIATCAFPKAQALDPALTIESEASASGKGGVTSDVCARLDDATVVQ